MALVKCLEKSLFSLCFWQKISLVAIFTKSPLIITVIISWFVRQVCKLFVEQVHKLTLLSYWVLCLQRDRLCGYRRMSSGSFFKTIHKTLPGICVSFLGLLGLWTWRQQAPLKHSNCVPIIVTSYLSRLESLRKRHIWITQLLEHAFCLEVNLAFCMILLSPFWPFDTHVYVFAHGISFHVNFHKCLSNNTVTPNNM